MMAMIPALRIENKDKQHQKPKPKNEAKAHFFLWSKEGENIKEKLCGFVLVLNFLFLLTTGNSNLFLFLNLFLPKPHLRIYLLID